MREEFLHFVWKYQIFDRSVLKLQDGQVINILHPGTKNSHAGPDFSHAKIKIGEVEWHGMIEIHVSSSDWTRHHHDQDTLYDGVVLHVVFEDDVPIIRSDGTFMPTLELKNRIDTKKYNQYLTWLQQQKGIPCQSSLSHIPQITKISAIESALMNRMQRKADEILKYYHQNQSWEDTTYWKLFQTFGFKTNAIPFLLLAQNTPLKILQKNADNLFVIESILFGQSALLHSLVSDDYVNSLSKEYDYQRNKYDLMTSLSGKEWKFAKMRPQNFPTIRIAQLAHLIYLNPSFFDVFLSSSNVSDFQKVFNVHTSTYWQHRFFEKTSAKKHINSLSADTVSLLIINIAVPLRIAFGQYYDHSNRVQQAVELLQQLKPEKNGTVTKMRNIGFEVTQAFDSQGLMELHDAYCIQKQCLNCKIGLYLLREK